MYIPDPFKEDDFDSLAEFIRHNSFGTLISVQDGLPFVSHLPFLFDVHGGSKCALIAHMARANPHWQILAKSESALTVFQGPHAYVSPSWYVKPIVPTWNYAVVHVQGIPRLIDDPQGIAEILGRLTAVHEASFDEPWRFDPKADGNARLLDMVVGIEIEVTELSGKFKLSQNRSPEDQSRVIKRLGYSGSAPAIELARLMADYLEVGPSESP